MDDAGHAALHRRAVMTALEPFARFKFDVITADAGGEQLAAMMDLGTPPTFVFTNSRGEEVARLAGSNITADSLIQTASKALKK